MTTKLYTWLRKGYQQFMADEVAWYEKYNIWGGKSVRSHGTNNKTSCYSKNPPHDGNPEEGITGV